MSQTLINTAKSVRQMVIHHVQSIPEELFDVQPEPFRNTIRWNVGHIVFCLDSFLSLGFPFHSNLPEAYERLFKPGIRPTDWSVTPPRREELVQYLSGQLNSISGVSPSTLDESLKSPIEMGPLRFETVGEVFNFAFIHETMHYTTISCLLKVIQQK